MLNRLQSLFNRLAGVPDAMTLQGETGRKSRPQSYSALEKPACWRRRSRKMALAAAHDDR